MEKKIEVQEDGLGITERRISHFNSFVISFNFQFLFELESQL